jgi:hypothetical protein
MKLRTLLTVALAIGTLALTTGCEEIGSNQPLTAQGEVDPVGGLEDYLTSQPPANSVGGAEACQCITKTCTPAYGDNAGVETTYPATGVDHELGKWCFVSESCGTTIRGNAYSCNGTKFAFVQPSTLPDWAQGDWRKYKAAPAAPAVTVSCGEGTKLNTDGTQCVPVNVPVNVPAYDCFRGGYCSKAAAIAWFTEANGNIYAGHTIDSSGCAATADRVKEWNSGEYLFPALINSNIRYSTLTGALCR